MCWPSNSSNGSCRHGKRQSGDSMSELRTDTITASDGTSPVTLTGQYPAKAWVNYNGAGAVAIRQSGGISSISDTATGSYTLNFTTAMPDADYAVTLGSQPVSTNEGYDRYDTLTTTSFNVQHRESAATHDSVFLSAVVVR